jgi:chemotaxis protein MotB
MSNIDMDKYAATVNTFGDIFGSTAGDIKGVEAPIKNSLDFKPAPSLIERLEQVVSENGYGAAIKLIQNERGITVSILDDILFASGKADLTTGPKNVLNKLSNVIRTIPNDLRIEGHTDNVPINSNTYPSNWHLSVARATNTAYYLMTEEGIPQGRVSIVGYSEYKPVAPNDTPEGRAQNRRVDIVILNK